MTNPSAVSPLCLEFLTLRKISFLLSFIACVKSQGEVSPLRLRSGQGVGYTLQGLERPDKFSSFQH